MRRLAVKPHQFVLGIGVLAALFTIASGIVPRLTGWEESSSISREVFGGVPDPVYWLFYTTAPVVLFICAWLVALRVRNYERGRPDDRRTTKANAHHRLADFRSGVWMRTLLRDPAAGVMHSFIYFGFLVLLAATIILEIDHQLPDDLKFLHGEVYQAYAATADIFGVVFVIGILWAIGRRYIQRPYRIRIKTKPEDAVILVHVPRDRDHRLLHGGVPPRRASDAVVRAVVARRLPARAALRGLRLVTQHLRRPAHDDVDRALRGVRRVRRAAARPPSSVT